MPSELDDATILAATPDLRERLERIERGILPWFSRLEEHAAANEAALEARLEKLETRLVAAHDASIEAVGLLAGQLVARLEEQVAGIESAIEARHERLVAHVEASMGERHAELLTQLDGDRSATVEALSGLASGVLVDRLLEGVVALGEVLDADLVNLRRLITEERIGPISPRQVEAEGEGAVRDGPTQPEVALDRAPEGFEAGSEDPPP